MHPTTNHDEPARPGAWWYALGALLIVGGAAAFIICLGVETRRIHDRIEGMARVTLPAGGQVRLDEAGSYSIFYEVEAGQVDARIPYAELEPVLLIRPAAPADAQDRGLIEASPVRDVEAYPHDDRHGYSIARFEAPAAGRYHIGGRLKPGDHPEVTVAVGRLELRRTMGRWDGVFGGAVAATLGLVGGSLTLILTFLVRRRQFTTRDD